MASEYPPLPYVCPLCHWSWATEHGMRVHIPVEHNTTLDRFDAWQEETTNAINYHVSVNERLTAQLAAVTAERDALRGWQAGQTHYVGCWREHRRCALTTIDFEAARREHAELALREAVAELNRLREGQDDERR